jgi:hypothetical protein
MSGSSTSSTAKFDSVSVGTFFRVGKAMFNLVGCMVVGAIFGLFYAWHRTAPSFEHSVGVLNELQREESARRRGLAHVWSYRIGIILFGALVGAVLGLLPLMAGYLLFLLAHQSPA